MPNEIDATAPNGDVENNSNIPQNNAVVNVQDVQNTSSNNETLNPDLANVKFSIGYTTDNRPVVVVDENIIEGKDPKEHKQIIMDTIREKKPGVSVGGRFIKINKQTVNEYLNSEYSNHLKRTNTEKHNDKLLLSNNLDEVVKASDNYVNEEPKHGRTDNIKELGRGQVLIQIGDNKYDADVIVGYTNGNSMVLYDVVNMNESNFDIKKSGDFLDGEHTDMNSIRKESPDNNMVPQNDGVVNIYDMPSTENNALENELNFARENAVNGLEENENDSRKMKLAKRVMRTLNERYGLNFKLYSGESFVNGFYENGTVYINDKGGNKPSFSLKKTSSATQIRQIDNPDLNGFIEYLNDFANDLAGKTGGLDRAVIKSMGGAERFFLEISFCKIY